MNLLKQIPAVVLMATSMGTMATEFSFDRPGSGISTGITPVGQLAWEQGLPSLSYDKTTVDGSRQTSLLLNADMLLRTGLAPNLELQLGWQGPAWSRVKYRGQSTEEHGLGDVSIGLKKAIDLHDERLNMAVLAEAILATGNEAFSNQDDIYSLSSVVAYDYNDLITTSITMRYEAQNSDWAVTAIPTLEYQIAGNWSGFSEFVYRKAESQPYETSLASGLIYQLNQRTQLDASIGVGLNGAVADYTAGLGVAFLF